MAEDLPELTVPDAAGWRAWLREHHGDPTGVWLVLAKKGTTKVLDEGLCCGWAVLARGETPYPQKRAGLPPAPPPC